MPSWTIRNLSDGRRRISVCRRARYDARIRSARKNGRDPPGSRHVSRPHSIRATRRACAGCLDRSHVFPKGRGADRQFSHDARRPADGEGEVAGVIALSRRLVEPFSEREIQLVTTFADQAVIAIENTRLITETRAALEQQTATAEVLQVINSSPDDLAPVFDAMLEKAMRLCGADFGVMNRYDGKHFYHAADNGVPSAYARYRRERGPITYGSGTTPARLVAGENLIHTADLMATEAYERGEPARRALVDLGGARTHLTAALWKGDVLLGDISIYRQEVRPFTNKQIALLQNFAAQAVIAMENARLLAETREALEQQTATAEVLQVINSSPGDLT